MIHESGKFYIGTNIYAYVFYKEYFIEKRGGGGIIIFLKHVIKH